MNTSSMLEKLELIKLAIHFTSFSCRSLTASSCSAPSNAVLSWIEQQTWLVHFQKMGEFRKTPDCQQADFLFTFFFLCVKKQRDKWVGVLEAGYMEITIKSEWLRSNFPLICFLVGAFLCFWAWVCESKEGSVPHKSFTEFWLLRLYPSPQSYLENGSISC